MSLKDRRLLSVKVVGGLNPLKSSELNKNNMLVFTNIYIATQVTSIFEVAELIKF